jgi:hypothetical protein
MDALDRRAAEVAERAYGHWHGPHGRQQSGAIASRLAYGSVAAQDRQPTDGTSRLCTDPTHVVEDVTARLCDVLAEALLLERTVAASATPPERNTLRMLFLLSAHYALTRAFETLPTAESDQPYLPPSVAPRQGSGGAPSPA